MRNGTDYPLSVSAFVIAVLAACMVGVSFDNLSAAYAVFVLIFAVGLVWRKGDPPVLPFILVYQWISVTAGYWYQGIFDSFPGIYKTGDVPRTMFLALT